MDDTIKIYALLNPLTNSYFYVGVTTQRLKKRLSCHMSSTDKNEKKVEIIREISYHGQRPRICLVEELDISNIELSTERELYWIKRYLQEGHPLVNKSLSKVGRKPSADPKMAIHLSVEESDIEHWGGKEALKEKLYEYIDRYCKAYHAGEYERKSLLSR